MRSYADELAYINRFKKTAPVDVVGAAAALGISVRSAYLENDLSGMIECVNGRYAITVNASHSQTRQRFTIAHELGHYMLHRHLIGNGVDDDRMYRSTPSGRFRNMKVGPQQETEANKFAAEILMPMALVTELRAHHGLITVNQLADRLQVSRHAMSIRLGVPYEAPPPRPRAEDEFEPVEGRV